MLAHHVVLEVLGATAAYQHAVLTGEWTKREVELAHVSKLARTSRALREHAVHVLRAGLRARSYLVADQDARIPTTVLEVLVPWVCEVLTHSTAVLPTDVEHNVMVCCRGARGRPAAARLLEDTLCPAVLEHADVCQRTHRAIWLANIKTWTSMADEEPHSSYCALVREMQYVQRELVRDGPSIERLERCRRLCAYFRLTNRGHRHRTIPEPVVDATCWLVAGFVAHAQPAAPFAMGYVLATQAALECCAALDVFAHQLQRVLDGMTRAVRAARPAYTALLDLAVELLEHTFSSATDVRHTLHWMANFRAYCGLLEATLVAARAGPAKHDLDVHRLVRLVGTAAYPSMAVSAATAALATHVVWHRCCPPGDLNLADLYTLARAMPRTLVVRDLETVFVAVLRAVSRRAVARALSSFDVWYIALLLENTLEQVPVARLYRRRALRKAWRGCLDLVFVKFYAPRLRGALDNSRVVYYTVTLFGRIARACASSRRLAWCFPVARIASVLRYLTSDMRDCGVGTEYCVLHPLFQLVDHALRSAQSASHRTELLLHVPDALLEAWFEHRDAIDLAPVSYLCFLAQYAPVQPSKRLLWRHAEALASARRPARAAPILDILAACEPEHSAEDMRRVLGAILPTQDTWSPHCVCVARRLAERLVERGVDAALLAGVP